MLIMLWKESVTYQNVPILRCFLRGKYENTSSYSQNPHNTDDSGVDWKWSIHLDLLQNDAHDGEKHNGQI